MVANERVTAEQMRAEVALQLRSLDSFRGDILRYQKQASANNMCCIAAHACSIALFEHWLPSVSDGWLSVLGAQCSQHASDVQAGHPHRWHVLRVRHRVQPLAGLQP